MEFTVGVTLAEVLFVAFTDTIPTVEELLDVEEVVEVGLLVLVDDDDDEAVLV